MPHVTRLRAEDAVLVLVDCQAGPLGMVRTMHETALATALASLAGRVRGNGSRLFLALMTSWL